jgi:cellulose synthase/poly-beta-1,6-N-acetylglucosamine synthase-like glycosyltransferase
MFKKGFAGGEDQELCFAVQLCGYKLWYEPSLCYTHYISSNRLTVNYLYKTILGTSKATPVIKLYQSLLIKKTLKGRIKKLLYTSIPLIFLHDFYILLVGIIQGFSSPYKKIIWYTSFIRFRSSCSGLFMLKGKLKMVLKDITKLQEN